MNKIKYTFYSLVAMLFFSFAVSAQCTYTVDMTDNAADGWDNGGFLTVTVNAGAPMNFTVLAGASAQGTFMAGAGDVIVITYTDGSFDFENNWSITDCNGNLVNNGNGGDYDGNDQQPAAVATVTSLGQFAAGTCENVLTKADSFGDGWNGNTVTITVNGTTYADVHAPDEGLVNVPTSVDCIYNFLDGDVVDVTFNGQGSFINEVSYSWTDAEGTVQFSQSGPAAGTSNTVTVSCPTPCTFICPTDVPTEVTLGPGECEYALTFTIEVTGFCQVLGDQTIGFTGPFDPDANTFLGNQETCYSLSNSVITMTSTDFQSTCNTFTFTFIAWDAPADGEISFDYSTSGGSPGLDHVAYGLDILAGGFIFPGNFVELFTAPNAAGTVTVPIAAGQQFGLVTWVQNGPHVNDGDWVTGNYFNFTYSTFVELPEGPLTITEYVPIGLGNVVEYCVTDTDVGEVCCTYDVDVLSYPFAVTSLACNDLVNVSVNEDCQVEVNADMFLEGGPYACYTVDYGVYISGVPGNVNGQSISLAPGTYQVTVEDFATGNTCWGDMLVEDKLAPTIDCNCPVGGEPQDFTNFSENLGDPDLQATMANACLNFGGGAPVGTNHWYDEYDLTVTVTGNYIIQQNTSWGDGQINIYSAPFNPNDVCANLIGGSSDVNGFDPEVNDNFTAGVTYYFVFTSWGGGQGGPYTINSSGPGTLVGSELVIADECIVNCIEDLDINLPVVMDNCDDYTLLPPNDTYSDGEGCNETLIRSWAVTDGSGTIVATCSQEFIIEPLTFADIFLPPALVELPCGSGTDPADIKAYFDNPLTNDIAYNPPFCTLEDVVENCEGTPFAYPYYFLTGCDGNQHPQAVDNSVCNIYATYEDQDIPACGVGCDGNSKVIRTWTLLDWCTGALTNYVQVIKAVDQEAPTFTVNDATVSTDPWGCSANTTLPIPWELHDNCDENPTYTVSGPAGVIIVGSPYDYTVLNAPKGVHTFTYNAEDCCGNVGTETITITVVDQAAPVPVAKQNIIIGLTSSGTAGNGTAKLFASSVDNGSHDGCTDVHIEIRRDTDACNVVGNTTYDNTGHPQDDVNDPDGGQFVKFCCADLTEVSEANVPYGTVKVWMRVWDDGDMNGSFGSAGDNYNEIWVDVRVEDKLAPALVCPPDVTIECDQDHTDLSLTGSAQAYATCDGLSVDYTDTDFLNACNEGFVQRRWFIAGNPFGTFCIQRITIQRNDPPFNGVITWPNDMTVNCTNANAGEPSWVAGPCDVIGYDVDSDTFFFEDGACFKILNEYTVIDWCQYEPNSPFWDGEGIWTHVQIIKVVDNISPEISCEDTMYPVNDNNDEDGDGNLCENRAVMLTNTAVDGGGDCMSEWLKWQIEIDVWGDNTVDYVFSSFVPPFSPFYVQPTGSNEEVKVTIPEDIESSMSNHKVYWQVTDGCGNNSGCGNTFMVVDKKAPTPYCVSLSSALMDQSGEVELWAIDFNIGSFDNCTEQEDLRYTFTSTPPAQDPLYDEDRRSSSQVFDCDDLPQATVNMYVWDEKGNSDFCVVTLTLVDNFGACDPDGGREIAGKIETEVGDGVEEVEVTLSSNLPESPITDMSNVSGSYAFPNNPMSVDYNAEPARDGDYMNGVSTLDLVLIQRHILNLEQFTSPYKVIAADINSDAKVSAADLVDLRKLILGVNTELENNTSWRFVDGAQTFADATKPWPFTESIEIVSLSDNMMDNDFVGVKIGDVNGSVEANFNANSSEVRTSNTVTFRIAEQTVEAGQEVSVEINSADFADVYGYQFTMELNGLNFASVDAGAVAMTSGNIGVLKSNLVTVSYSNINAVTAGSEEGIFTMNFTADKAGQLSDMIKITSRATQAEAYVGSSLEINDIELSIITEEGEEVSDSYALNQNEPNPFKDVTTISFYSPENASATITVYDVTGKVVTVRDIEAVKGHNETTFTKSDLNVSGILHYTLVSGDFTATKKMIIIE